MNPTEHHRNDAGQLKNNKKQSTNSRELPVDTRIDKESFDSPLSDKQKDHPLKHSSQQNNNLRAQDIYHP